MKERHSILEITKGTSTNAEGYTLYSFTKKFIDRKETVLLSWKNSIGISSSFLNSFMGELMDTYEMPIIQKYVKFDGLTKTQSNNLKSYITKYKELRTS